MAEAVFFVRMRGKISGPFGVDALRRMVRQGMLSRVHEISADRKDWTRAAEYEDLFPSAVPAHVASTPTEPEQTYDTAPESAPVSPVTISAVSNYFYSQNGSSIGPVSVGVLGLLAQNGSLGPDDLVWREEAETGVPARQMPVLTQYFSSMGRSNRALASTAVSITPSQKRSRQSATAQASSFSLLTGIVAGAAILLSLLLPWVVVGNQMVWTWSVYRENGAGGWALLSTYLILAGVALCVIAPLTSGIARGICYVSLAGGAVLFALVAVMSNESASGSLLVFLAPVALAGLVGVCATRSGAPELMAGRVLLGIFSGISAIGLLTFCILLANDRSSMEHVPNAVALWIVLAIAGALAGLAASVMGFIGLKPRFSPGLNLTTWILALIGIGLPLMGFLVAFTSAMDPWSELPFGNSAATLSAESVRSAIILAIIRFIAIWCAILTILASGLYELLMAVVTEPRSAE